MDCRAPKALAGDGGRLTGNNIYKVYIMLKKLFSSKKNPDITSDLINILRLIRSENVGSRTFHSLIKMFGSASAALEKVADFSLRGGKTKAIKVCPLADAEREIEKLHKNGAKLIAYNDAAFSLLLRQIPDCPPILSYKGNKALFNSTAVAIVGARNASLNGKAFAGKIASELVRNDIAVVSGLARGIDTAAHEAAITKTIAVIAGGIDHIYPPENNKLFEQIAEQGLLIAELPIGSAPLAQHFPQRNRIISGLSLGMVVVEAGLKSGSLITARFALEQNREVFAVPGFPLDPRCQGSNRLIKEGAYLIENASDIIENLPLMTEIKTTMSDKLQDQIDFRTIKIDDALLNDRSRKKITESLSSMPVDIEQLIEATELPIPVIYTILLELELAGRINRHPGNKFSLMY